MNQRNQSNGDPDQSQTVDLDQFLNTSDPTGQTPPDFDNHFEMPNADRMAVVGIFVDDSGSMSGQVPDVKAGVKLSVEAFRGAKGSDFYLDIRGFRQTYFSGMIKDFTDGDIEGYAADYGNTPLFSHSIALLKTLRAMADQYVQRGIPTTVSLLMITDGQPQEDETSKLHFTELAKGIDYVVGMGIAQRESDMSIYAKLFKEVGIDKVVTAKTDGAHIRHAINQFSQSVAAIATS